MTRLAHPSIAGAAVALFGLGCTEPASGPVTLRGAPSALGGGTAETFVELDPAGTPTSIGVAFSATALDGLPDTPTDRHRCYDGDGDGALDDATECSAWHEFVLPLPSDVARRADIPFKWALVNWNNHGHIPPGIWDVPHFDVHFYLERIERIFALQRGPCGPEFLRCDQFEAATRPLPPNYMPPDYQDVGAAAPAMGNHLIDPTGPEFHGQPFERHWIFGTYDGRVIFYEEMVALDYLRARPDACSAIKSPEAVAVTGYYPRSACVRYSAERDEYTVSMEDFVMREASPPLPVEEAGPDAEPVG